jgi:PTH1 family peptidyl-tRNA hydrolase
MRLVVGLGNPGREYEATRHNVGFWWVDGLAGQARVPMKREARFHGEVGKLVDAGRECWLLKPTTFMNLSGRAVQALAQFYKVDVGEILVVHDELDFPPGVAKLKQGGGIAGHNGLKDISQRLATHEYWRLRLGVGKPPPGREGADYVLEKPPAEERAAIEAAIQRALDVLPLMLSGDMQAAMNKLHTEEKKPEPQDKAAPLTEPEPPAPKKTGLRALFGKK